MYFWIEIFGFTDRAWTICLIVQLEHLSCFYKHALGKKKILLVCILSCFNWNQLVLSQTCILVEDQLKPRLWNRPYSLWQLAPVSAAAYKTTYAIVNMKCVFVRDADMLERENTRKPHIYNAYPLFNLFKKDWIFTKHAVFPWSVWTKRASRCCVPQGTEGSAETWETERKGQHWVRLYHSPLISVRDRYYTDIRDIKEILDLR